MVTLLLSFQAEPNLSVHQRSENLRDVLKLQVFAVNIVSFVYMFVNFADKDCFS